MDLHKVLLLTMAEKEQHILELKELLNQAIIEKNEAMQKCRITVEENLLLQQQLCYSEKEKRKQIEIESYNGLSSLNSDESIVSSASLDFLPAGKPLPEKGKLLQAVMNAGPLLETLLLAGPLPEWRHPPPPIDAHEIPPPPLIVNCGRKRRLSDGSEASPELKYQRILLQ